MLLEFRVDRLESDIRRCQSELQSIRDRTRARSDFWLHVVCLGIYVEFWVILVLILKALSKAS